MDFSESYLSYRPVKKGDFEELLTKVIVLCKGTLVDSAMKEYAYALEQMMDKTVTYSEDKPGAYPLGYVIFDVDEENNLLKEDGFQIQYVHESIYVTGKNEAGLLYGVFEFLRQIQREENLILLNIISNPTMKFRMMNHWDNMDGSIERGYSGQSFFYKNYDILFDERIITYTRMMAAIGINAIVINNVNVHEKETYLITDRYLSDLKKYAELFSRYGIKLFVSVNFAAPMELDESIDVADPLDERVIQWWEKTTKHVYECIPNFGGYLVKADSEGRPGPFTYNRTHADGANMLGKALQPYGGILVWRCFVYNCGQDWRDRKTDRARAAYDNFMPLDGKFMDNVILQIKNGPMDFQVREPVSPLFGGLKKTNMMLEVQIAQEYTGQQKDLCYLIPMWKEILDFQTYSESSEPTVADLVSGKTYQNTNCGMAGVINTGDDFNWTGNDLAAANLYGYGRLCFNPELSAEDIAKEWVKITFTNEESVVKTIVGLLMGSWPTYEKYCAPLGVGWMVTPHYHYGPDVDGYEYDRWGTYHYADCKGIGVDRTLQGTGYASLYGEPNASMYESLEDCPEELLLFFHHVGYDHVLSTGKTIIQHIYDTHFEGVEEVEEMIAKWNGLEGKIPEDAFSRVKERFQMQKEDAVEWRDRINTYFYRKSGIPDNKNRKIY